MRSLDFETRSACDLLNEGAYRYATDPTTDAICCSWRMPDGAILSWWPEWVARALDEESPYLPYAGNGLVSSREADDYDDMYTAWNSAFDRLIWQYICEQDYGFARTEIPDWLCSSALARANGLPAKLENAAIALGIRAQKDKRGKELIKLLSIPQGGTRYEPEFNEDPKLLREMIAYCEQDVRVEHAMLEQLRPFLPHELHEFHVNERVNDRGIGFDKDFAEIAVTYGDAERAVLEEQLARVTNDEIERPTQYQRVKKWLLTGYYEFDDAEDKQGNRYALCNDHEYEYEDDDGKLHKSDTCIYCGVGADTGEVPRVNDEAVKQMTIYKGGERKISLDKNIRHNLLELYNEDPRILTPEALEVIQVTDLANKSSTAKYKRMLQREIEGRVYGAYMFGGAISTGRFSAHGIQPHNMVRDVVDDFDESLAGLHAKTDVEVIHTLAKMMRPTIIGVHLHWSDWSNVEGRACPWLANTQQANKKLDMFRHQDAHPDEPDVYERMAARMGYDDRQAGKVLELSMQFGGGVGAGQAMARNYNLHMTNPQMKDGQKKWRMANPWAEPFWYNLKDAAWNAIARPGEMFKAGRVTYFYTPGSHNGLGTLWCQLPSKRLLAYVNPKFERVPCPWDEEQTMIELTAIKANFLPKQGEKEWPRYKLWYGVLCENITQAVCADLLRDALVRFDEAGLDVVLHTHDEIIVENERDVSDEVVAIMEYVPEWAEGLPLAADIHRGYRYKQK